MIKTTDNLQEMFVVVDKNDTILGYKSRNECHHDKTLIHRVTNIAVFNKKGEVLMQKRSATKDLYPGMYTLSASGHVAIGETYEQAAKREMAEEIGTPELPIAFVEKRLVEAATETEMLVLFKTQYEGPFRFNKDEVDSLTFFDKERVKEISRNLTPCASAGLQILGLL